jgi:uncharacterized protein (DUF427 family)
VRNFFERARTVRGIEKGIQAVTARLIRMPRPDHPIAIGPNRNHVVVSVAGRIIADTRDALTLRESNYGLVLYFPRKDVDLALLERTDHATYCPCKGEAAYYAIPLGGERSINAVWTYEAPYAWVAEIKDYVAFCLDRVDVIAERSST